MDTLQLDSEKQDAVQAARKEVGRLADGCFNELANADGKVDISHVTAALWDMWKSDDDTKIDLTG